jgi:hypothetical protein
VARSVNLVGAGEGIKFPSSSNHLPCSIAETDCLSVSGDPHPAARAVKSALTANDPDHGDEGMETSTRKEKLARVRQAGTILAPKSANQTCWLVLLGWSCSVRLSQFVLAPAPALPLAELLNEPAWLIVLLK